MKRISTLPSLLTLGTFTCGLVSIVLCLATMKTHAQAEAMRVYAATETLQIAQLTERHEELFFYACMVIFIAMIFDMLDGRVARMTGSVSQFGAELDSLADDCAFGVAPATIVATLWILHQPPGKQWYGQVFFCCSVYAACTILRLARYNVRSSTTDKNYFSGLPSPGAAGAAVSAVLFFRQDVFKPLWQWLFEHARILNPELHSALELQVRALACYLLLLGVLMFTKIRFVHVANKYMGAQQRITGFVAFVFFLGFLFWSPIWILFMIFNGYLLWCIGHNARRIGRKGAFESPDLPALTMDDESDTAPVAPTDE